MPSIAVVGGGFGGVGAVTMLARAGHHDVTVFERSDRVGGVWNDNTYPGAACDVPSHLYEFSFAPNPRWSRRYAPQRSPGWTFPRMDFAYKERTKRTLERYPMLQRLDRQANFAFHELGAAAMTGSHWLLPAFRAIGRSQIKKTIKDPELRRKVTPTDEIGCKRVMLSDDWYPTLTKPNVDLITDRIAEITSPGV